MIYCCNRYFGNTEKKALLNSLQYHDRVLEYGTCPHCNTLIAELTEKNVQKQIRRTRKRKEKAKSLIGYCLTEKYYDIYAEHIKQGSKSNMQWVYQYNGQAKDFNNVIKFNCKTDLKIVSITQDTAPSQAGAFSS